MNHQALKVEFKLLL